MLRIQTVLHPTDFSDSAEAALRYALDLARRHEATLHLLHVTRPFGENPVRGAFAAQIDEAAFYRDLRDRMDGRMQEMLSRHDLAGVRIQRVHSRGVASDVITDYAASEDMDLLVLGTHGWRGVRRLLLGSVARDVVHLAPCPIVTVRAADDPARVPPERILAPIDFSVHSLHALAYAKQLAATFGASLDVLHVIDPVMTEAIQHAGWTNRAEAERAVRAKASEKLAWLSSEVEGPGPIALTEHLRVGYPSEEIQAFAEERGTDLIVIATHGLRAIQRFPMGSVADRVLRTTSVPVFLTRPFGKSLLPNPPAATRAMGSGEPRRSEPA